MRIEHKWHQERQAAVRAPKYVPIEQCKAAVDLASHNATGFTIQMVQEQMILMLHEEFGFGRERCMRALETLQIRLAEWQSSVTQEFDAETFRMNYKQREDHRAELDFTWAKHDAALEPLVDPETWKPYKERYRGFGGTGAWCD